MAASSTAVAYNQLLSLVRRVPKVRVQEQCDRVDECTARLASELELSQQSQQAAILAAEDLSADVLEDGDAGQGPSLLDVACRALPVISLGKGDVGMCV